jgi:hypothetical protein
LLQLSVLFDERTWTKNGIIMTWGKADARNKHILGAMNGFAVVTQLKILWNNK